MSNFLKVGEGLSFLKLSAAPSSPAEGMVYYDDTLNTLRYYDGTQWIDVSDNAVDSVNGQTGTVVLDLNDINDVDVAAPTDGQVLTYNNGTGNWEAETPAVSGANTALSNLASTAVNADILPDTDSTLDLGSPSLNWDNTWTKLVRSNGQLDLIAESADIQLSNLVSGDIRLAPQGQIDVLAPIDMNGFKVIALGSPTAGTDAASKNYVDNQSQNYVTNGQLEVSSTNYGTYADAAGVLPVDGTGGSPVLTAGRSTSSPLSGVASLLITKDAANRQGNGVNYAMTVDLAAAAKVLTLKFDYKSAGSFAYNAGTAANPSDLAIYIYDVTNSTLIYPSQSFLDGSGKFVSQFQTSAVSTSYRILFHVATTNAAAWTMQVDNLSVSSEAVTTGAVMSDWISYTPSWTASGTNPAIGNGVLAGQYRRVGGDLEFKILMRSGTTTTYGTGTYNFSLPSGLTMDLSRIVAGADFKEYLGSAEINLSNGVAETGFVTGNSTLTSVKILPMNNTNYGGAGFGPTVPLTLAASTPNQDISFSAKVPISGWSTNVAVSSDYGNRVIAFAASKSSSQSIPASTDTVITGFATPSYDTTASFNPSLGTFTAPESGMYHFDASWTFAGSGVAWTSYFGFTVNGTYTNLTIRRKTADAVAASYQISQDIRLNAGDVVRVIVWQDSGSGKTNDANALWTYFNGHKIQSPQTLAGGEVVAFIGTNNAGTSIVNASGGQVVPMVTSTDTHGGWNGTRYTFSQSGIYQVTGQITFNALIVGTFPRLVLIYVNGAPRFINRMDNGGSTGTESLLVSGLVKVVAGDYVELLGDQYSGSNRALITSSTYNYLTINKVN